MNNKRYTKGIDVPKVTKPTIGVEFHKKIVTLKNKERVKAQIWDTGKYFFILLNFNQQIY